MQATKYLLVDDEDQVIHLLQDYVARKIETTTPHTVRNGEEALHITKSEKFDFIITDFYMPKVNGVDFIQLVRKLEGPNQRTPIILLSAYNPNLVASHTEEAIEQLNWDNVFFMDKPINTTQLDHYINCCLKLSDHL